jgi:hypothetical protein
MDFPERLRYNPSSRPNGRVFTARFFWAIVFASWICGADLQRVFGRYFGIGFLGGVGIVSSGNC